MNSKDGDQLANLHGLVCTFIIRSPESTCLTVEHAMCTISKFWLVAVVKQAGLRLKYLVKVSKDSF